jgi:hypothetical protein
LGTIPAPDFWTRTLQGLRVFLCCDAKVDAKAQKTHAKAHAKAEKKIAAAEKDVKKTEADAAAKK